MQVKIGTFNLNNLFGRFNFEASIEEITPSGTYSFNPKDKYWIRNFMGNLVKPKDENETKQLAEIIRSGVDILAVQEVEDKDTLKRFNKEHLGGEYKYLTVIDGNDRRLIDVGILSKYPFGAITSWQFYPDPKNPGEPIFSRDLLQVEILNLDTREHLFTFFITHLKSKFIPWQCKEECEEKQREEDNQKRLRQCEAIEKIIEQQMGRDQRFIVAGDFNDTPDSEYLTPLLNGKLGLVNIVNQCSGEKWTYSYEGEKQQLDYILVPPAMLGAVQNPEIGECRLKVKAPEIPRCGSDHRPVFATLDL